MSYTGSVGTEYTSDANVDFWQLRHGGDNQSIIRDADKVSAVEVGDILFMKGKLFPTAPNGLVHKAPEKRYHDDGSVINRLLLKVDVMPSDRHGSVTRVRQGPARAKRVPLYSRCTTP